MDFSIAASGEATMATTAEKKRLTARAKTYVTLENPSGEQSTNRISTKVHTKKLKQNALDHIMLRSWIRPESWTYTACTMYVHRA